MNNESLQARKNKEAADFIRLEKHKTIFELIKSNNADELLIFARARIELWKLNKTCSEYYVDEWERVLNNPELFEEIILNPKNHHLRQNTPFRMNEKYLASDYQSLEFHTLIAAKLKANPSLVNKALDNIDRWRKQNDFPQPHLDDWLVIINSGIEPLLDFMVGESDECQRLRSSSPFVGDELITQQERMEIWNKYHKLTVERERKLTENEKQKLIDVLSKHHNPDFLIIFLTSLKTGMHGSEILSLEAKNIHPNYIQRTIKGDEPKKIVAGKIIETLYAIARQKQPNEKLFNYTEGEFDGIWNKVLIEAEVSDYHF